MATVPKSRPIKVKSHVYNLDAHLMDGELKRPAKRKIDLPEYAWKGTRDGHTFRRADAFDLDGLISFESGYTHVSGNHSDQEGWVGVATAVVEDLNILDVITADRIVAQVSTEHPTFDGHVPRVTFIGTRFENLRIGGCPVQLELDLTIVGDRSIGDDRLYSEDTDFLDRVRSQRESIHNVTGLPHDLQVQYHSELDDLKKVKGFRGPYAKGYASTLKCSLVTSASAVPVAKSYGNVLQIPGFGTVGLASLEIQQTWDKDGGDPDGGVTTYFDLTMLEITMGSIGEGNVQVANVGANGHTRP